MWHFVCTTFLKALKYLCRKYFRMKVKRTLEMPIMSMLQFVLRHWPFILGRLEDISNEKWSICWGERSCYCETLEVGPRTVSLSLICNIWKILPFQYFWHLKNKKKLLIAIVWILIWTSPCWTWLIHLELSTKSLTNRKIS